jgi:arylsulfatase A-like enzyme
VSAHPDSTPRADPASSEVAATALCSAAAAALWAAGSAGRLAAAAGSSRIACFLALWATALPLVAAGAMLARAARLGLSRLVPDAPSRRLALVAAALWGASSVIALSVFGRMLHGATHHRGLGGATYGIVGAVVVGACALGSVRAAQAARRLLARPAVAWTVAAGCAVVIAVVLRAALRIPKGASAAGPEAVAAFDAAVLVGLAILASAVAGAARVALVVPRVGVMATAAVVAVEVLGLGLATRIPATGHAAASSVLVVAPMLDLVAAPGRAAPPGRSGAAEPPDHGVTPAPSAPWPDDSSELTAPLRAPGSAPSRPDKPDLVLVTLDSVRADHLGAYGYKRATSPRFDALAAQSALFERAYAAGPETRSALAPVVVGSYLEQCARDDRAWPTLLDSNETLAERLGKAGYATGAVTSFRWLSRERGFAQGFEVFDESAFQGVNPEKKPTSEQAVARAIDVWERLAGSGKPVFLWMHLFDAHARYLRHDGAGFGEREVDLYDGEIAYQDAQLGKLLDKLLGSERASRTVIVVHGSHGEGFDEHGYRGHPAAMYEQSVRVPLVVRFPWAVPRREPGAIVSVADLAPTLLELAGVEAPELPGTSLRPIVERPAGLAWIRGVLASHAGQGSGDLVRAWIEGNLRLFVRTAHGKERVSLFDLEADPEQKHDVAAERPEDAKRMRAELDKFVVQRVREVEPTRPR